MHSEDLEDAPMQWEFNSIARRVTDTNLCPYRPAHPMRLLILHSSSPMHDGLRCRMKVKDGTEKQFRNAAVPSSYYNISYVYGTFLIAS